MSDVAIIGGGPVGLGLAVALGLKGVSTTLIERFVSPSPIPKGQNLTQRTLEHFHFWGAEKALRAARTIPPEFGAGGVTAYRTLLSDFHYDWLKRELVRPFYLVDNERLPQYATEGVLRARLAELGTCETLYGWTASDLRDLGDRVEVDAVPRAGGPGRTIAASYAVGCDGSRSLAREKAGISQTLSDHDRLMVLLVFKAPALHAMLEERYPRRSFFCVLHPEHDGYWRFFGRVDLGTTFFFHCPVPPEARDGGFDFAALIQEAAGARFDVSLDHVGFWDLRVATADAYSAGRVFIAGDAAHSHPPYGGYGINTGFEDAANLAWKLDARLKGWGGPNLLTSYGLERRPVFASTAADFIERSIAEDRAFLRAHDIDRDAADFRAAWAARAGGGSADVFSFEPHYEGSPIVFGPAGATCSAVGRHAHAARPGHHLSPLALSDGRSAYDALGPGFTLFAFGASEAERGGFAAAARALRAPLAIVDEPAGAAPAYAARLVLVRPDQFVAWTSNEGDEPEAVMARVVGAR